MANCSLLINQPSEYLLHTATSIIQNKCTREISVWVLPALWYTPSRVVSVYRKGRSVENHQMLVHAAFYTGSYLYTVTPFKPVEKKQVHISL